MPYQSTDALARRIDSLRNAPGGGSIASGLAMAIRSRKANKLEKELSAVEAQNQANQQRELAMILRGQQTGRVGNDYVSATSEQFVPSDPALREMTAKMLMERASRGSEEYTLAPGAQRYRGSEVIAQAPFKPESPNFNQAFNPDGTPNVAYQDYMRRLREAGRSTTTTTLNVPGADNSYLQNRASAQAASMAELEKSATSAFTANQALERFVQSSASGDAGAAQPLVTGVKNFLASFGIDPEGLTDTTVMQQAIGQILGAKMSELGARGLTDRDMEVLRQALPQVAASHEARVQVADILRRSNESVIGEYRRQAQIEQERYPDYQFMRPSWFEGYGQNTGLTEEERAELEQLRAEFRGR